MTASVSLETALRQIAALGNLNADELIAYAAEDTDIGGYSPDQSVSKWPMGSMFGVEGQFLYALVRAMRPTLMCELGVSVGCSTTHILAAMNKNKKGKLLSVDQYETAGSLVPQSLRKRWEFVAGDARRLIPSDAEIIFEDLDHYAGTRAAYEVIKTLTPRLLIAHDAEHYIIGEVIRLHWQQVFGTFNTVLIDDANCGFAYKFGQNA